MEISIKEAADLIGGKIIGETNLVFSNLAKIEEAKKGDLTFLYSPAYSKYLENTEATAVIISPQFEKKRTDITYIEVSHPNFAFHKIMLKYFLPQIKLTGIAKSAYIDPTAKIGKNSAIGHNVVISANCIIGDNTYIFHNTVILENVKIGSNTLIYPNVSIREDCVVGNNVIIHSGTVIGSDGFGYNPDEKGVYNKIPQIGNVVLEDNVEIGSNVSVDRAALGSTLIKNGTKIDNLVQIAHNVSVGANTAISAQSGISGSTKIGSNCIIAGQAGFVGHIEIADRVLIGAQAGVSKSITKPGKYRGTPADELSATLRNEAHLRNIQSYAARIKSLEDKLSELEKIIKK